MSAQRRARTRRAHDLLAAPRKAGSGLEYSAEQNDRHGREPASPDIAGKIATRSAYRTGGAVPPYGVAVPESAAGPLVTTNVTTGMVVTITADT